MIPQRKTRVRATCARVFAPTLEENSSSMLEIRCQVTAGLPYVHVLGLSTRESRSLCTRLTGAFASIGVRFPTRRTIFCISPALSDGVCAKELDLAAALAYLLAIKELKSPRNTEILCSGALHIDGTVARSTPSSNFDPSKLDPKKFSVFCAIHLSSALTSSHLEAGWSGVESLTELRNRLVKQDLGRKQCSDELKERIDPRLSLWEQWDELNGQALAKRMLMIAAAGGHHALLAGSPGTGKSALASLMQCLLPLNDKSLAPYRAPLSSCTRASLIGSRHLQRVGELTLANEGILHVEECLEWNRESIEILRQPMDYGKALAQPRFLLIATTNLCPCGQRGSSQQACHCASYEVRRYFRRFSLALLDRIPLRLVLSDDDGKAAAPAAVDAARAIERARACSIERQKNINSRTSLKHLRQLVPWTEEAMALLRFVKSTRRYSLRAEAELCRVATTIADLDQHTQVDLSGLQEAIYFSRNVFEESLTWVRPRQSLGKSSEFDTVH